MSRRLITLTAALLGSMVATLAGQGTPPAPPQKPDQDKPAPFRVSVDVVAVDVQVIDRSGQPVPDLGPEKFTVTINGRRRRVVSAERIAQRHGRRAVASTAAAASMLRPRHRACRRLHQLRRDRVARRHPGGAAVRPPAVARRLRRPRRRIRTAPKLDPTQRPRRRAARARRRDRAARSRGAEPVPRPAVGDDRSRRASSTTAAAARGSTRWPRASAAIRRIPSAGSG